MSSKHPECDKLLAVKERSQAIGEFLEWLTGEKGVVLATWFPPGRLESGGYRIEKLLAEFFEIDLDKVEQEKRVMLEELREKQP
jgi:hypothetical protein